MQIRSRARSNRENISPTCPISASLSRVGVVRIINTKRPGLAAIPIARPSAAGQSEREERERERGG